MIKTSVLRIEEKEINLLSENKGDFISLTDMAKFKNPEATGLVISHWLSTRYTIEFMGLWETLNNKNFNVTGFSNIRNESGSNGFVLSNLESLNAVFIRQGLKQSERLVQLNQIAVSQMKSLINNRQLKALNSGTKPEKSIR